MTEVPDRRCDWPVTHEPHTWENIAAGEPVPSEPQQVYQCDGEPVPIEHPVTRTDERYI
jgi:hypothetical protein